MTPEEAMANAPDPAFAPEPLTDEDLRAHSESLREQAWQVFAALRDKLDDIEEAYDLFASQRDGVMKVAITV